MKTHLRQYIYALLSHQEDPSYKCCFNNVRKKCKEIYPTKKEKKTQRPVKVTTQAYSLGRVHSP